MSYNETITETRVRIERVKNEVNSQIVELEELTKKNISIMQTVEGEFYNLLVKSNRHYSRLIAELKTYLKDLKRQSDYIDSQVHLPF